MRARLVRATIVLPASVAIVACNAARPAQPLRPSYPTIFASAGYGATVKMAVRVERTGYASVIWRDTASASTLFGQSVRRAVTTTAWRPARRWGRARTDTLGYEVAFVLLRDTLPLGVNERYVLGNDTLPLVCPAPRTARRVVVCATPGRVRYSVAY